MRLARVLLVSGIALVLLAAAALLRPDFFLQAQGPAPYLVLSKEGRQPLAVTVVNGREMVSLDELSRLFGVTAREDQVARGLVLTVQGKATITLSSAQGLASIGGRVVSLSSPPVRQGNTWLVPIDVIDRALATVHVPKLDLRPRARLVVVGDLRVPRVAVRVDAAAGSRRASRSTSHRAPRIRWCRSRGASSCASRRMRSISSCPRSRRAICCAACICCRTRR